MKKTLKLLSLVFLSIFLISCQDDFNTTTTTTTTESNGDTTNIEDTYNKTEANIISYTSGVTFEAFKYDSRYVIPQVYIDITFKDIQYTPVNRKIAVAFDVADSSYINAEYYAVLQDVETERTQTLTRFYGGGSNFSSVVSFTIPDDSKDYRIVIGKYDTDNLNPRYGYIEGSAWIEWEDTNYTQRSKAYITGYVDKTADYSSDVKESYVSYSFDVLDEDQIITDVTVALYDSFDNVVWTETVNAASRRNGNKVHCENRIQELGPNVDYVLRVYVSGNDGFDDFENTLVKSDIITSAAFMNQYIDRDYESYHGLYGVIYEIEIVDGGINLHYVYVNDGLVVKANKDPVVLHISYYDLQNNLVRTYEITEGDNVLFIPNEDIVPRYVFRVMDQDEEHKFDQNWTPSLEPNINIYTDSYKEKDLIISSNLDNVISINVDVYINGYAALIESFSFDDFQEHNPFTIYHDVDYNTELHIIVTVTYEAYGVIYTKIY